MKLLVVLFLIFSGTGFSGEIERKIVDQDLVIVRLSKPEKKSLKPGQNVTFDMDESEPVVGKIQSIKGTKALVKIDWGMDALRNGQKVKFAEARPVKPKTKTKVSKSFETNSTPRLPLQLRAQKEFLFAPGRTYGSFISPAQAYQASKSQVQLGAYHFRPDWRRKTGRSKQSVTGDANIFDVTGLYVNERLGLRLGLSIGETKINYKYKQSGSSQRFKRNVSLKRPMMAIPINESTVFGAALGIYELEDKNFGVSTDSSVTFNRFDFGLIRLVGENEVGLLYLPPIDINENGVSVQTPLTVLAHYDWYVDANARLNGFVSHEQGQMISSDTINRITVSVGMDIDTSADEFWGVHLEHQSRSFSHHPNKSYDSIASTTLSFNQKIVCNEQSYFMYHLGYTYAGDDIKRKDADNTTIKVNDADLSLQYRYDF